VGETGVPAPVKRFVKRHIESVEQLEVLLLLRAAADKHWTAEEVARARVTHAEAAAAWLENLAVRGFVRHEPRGYRYDPPSAEAERTIDELAESYAKYRVAVVALIFSRPSERITLFSDAFRIRRPPD
jgi:hypothetical protein